MHYEVVSTFYIGRQRQRVGICLGVGVSEPVHPSSPLLSLVLVHCCETAAESGGSDWQQITTNTESW